MALPMFRSIKCWKIDFPSSNYFDQPKYGASGAEKFSGKMTLPLHARRKFLRTENDRWPMGPLQIFLQLLVITLARNANVENNCATMKSFESARLTCEIIEEIVDMHNKLRQLLAEGSLENQPAASNMREMYWDEELAAGAQKWANHCTFAHNNAEDREVERFSVGQNLGLTKSRRGRNASQLEFPRHIMRWFSEHTLYKFGPTESLQNLQNTGHYTQMVWATTYLVGCGYSRYKSDSNITYRLYVCHYGPGGNIFHVPPYLEGKPNCSTFLQPSRKYKSLCSLESPPSSSCT